MKKTVLYIGLMLLSVVSFAQKNIKGTVKDAEGQPMVGVNVYLVSDSTVGTTTDNKGVYSLTVKSSYEGEITAEFVGFTSQNKNIGPQKTQIINFNLKEKPTLLNQVVVTGTRTPKLLSEAPVQTRVITHDDIEKIDATNIMDVLQHELPSLEFSQAMNQQTTLNLSGFSGQGVLFLVDGERLSGETMDNVDFQRLDMNNVERVEIVKGAASALYGSAAAGGVINIITKNNQEKPYTLGISARYGSHKEKKLGANIGIHKGIVDNMFSLQYTDIATYDVNYHPDNDFNKVFGGKTWNFKDKIVINPLDNMKLTARAGYFFRERLYNEDAPDRYRDFNGGVKGNWEINDNNDVELAYSYDQYDKSDFIKASGKDIRDYSNVQNSVRGLYNHYFEKGEYSKILTVGGDFMHDYLMSYQFSDGAKSQNTADVFAQYDWNLNHSFEIVAALRYDYFSDGENSHLTEKISLRWHKGKITLRAGYGGGFRAPSLKEKYMDYDMANIFYIRGNKDLKSEISHNFNFSAEYTKDVWNVTALMYYNLVQNRISTSALKDDGDGTGKYVQYMNIDDINVYGGEITAQCRLPIGVNAKFCYSYTKEEVKQLGTLSPYAPARPHSFVARLDYDRQVDKNYGFNIALNGRFLSGVSAEKYNTTNQTSSNVDYPAYTMWKMSFTQRIMKKVKLTFAIDNIFNYKPDPYYFNSPITSGRIFYIDINVNVF